MTTSSLSLVSAALVLALASRSLAAPEASPSPAPTAADKETAREYMTEGRKRRASGDHKGALAAFASAHALMHAPTTGLELGTTQAQLGMLLEARETLLEAARHPAAGGEPPKFASARAEARALADALAPRIPTLVLAVQGVSSSVSVKVEIDGAVVAVPALPLVRKLNPGKHDVSVSVAGSTKRLTVELAEGTTEKVQVEAGASAQPAAKEAPAKPAAEPAPSASSTLAWMGFGVAAAGVVSGGITGYLSMSAARDLRDACVGGRCPPSTHADYDRGRLLGTVSTVSFAVAGAGVVLGAIGLWAAPKREPAAASVSLVLGPSGGWVVGAF
jgi:hypothetical protein